MKVSFNTKGDFKRVERRLRKLSSGEIFRALDRYGKEGVTALSAATPVDSAETAASWDYKIQNSKGSWSIAWSNDHMAGGSPVAILLQYGHGTGTGGYVQGRDYINPAVKPVFDKIAANVRKAVTSA